MNQWTNRSRSAKKNQKSLEWIQINNGPQQFKHLVTEALWGIFIWGLVRDGDDQVGFFLLWQRRKDEQNHYIITALTVITTAVMLCCWNSETREALVHISLWFSKQAKRTLLTGWSSARMFWANNILTVHHMSVENPFRMNTELMKQCIMMFCGPSLASWLNDIIFFMQTSFSFDFGVKCDMGVFFFRFTLIFSCVFRV